jgi:hypothetical protein
MSSFWMSHEIPFVAMITASVIVSRQTHTAHRDTKLCPGFRRLLNYRIGPIRFIFIAPISLAALNEPCNVEPLEIACMV